MKLLIIHPVRKRSIDKDVRDMMDYSIDTANMMKDPREKTIVDLRKPEDYRRGSLEGAKNIYWEEFESRFHEIPKERPLYLICYTGETSDEYAQWMEKQGYEAYSIREGYRGYLRWKLSQPETASTLTKKETESEITRKGNPRKPEGAEGEQMLQRMNESHAPVTEWALDFFDFKENDRVLDIGCGGGATLARMSGHIRTGALAGVDYSETSIKVSRERNEEDIRSGKMEILQASVEKLPFEDESFDKIITVESFYFWPKPEKNLEEVHRVLKRGGVFLLVADIYDNGKLKKDTVANVEAYQLFNPTEAMFRKLFEQAGFSAVNIHTKDGEDWICVEGIR